MKHLNREEFFGRNPQTRRHNDQRRERDEPRIRNAERRSRGNERQNLRRMAWTEEFE